MRENEDTGGRVIRSVLYLDFDNVFSGLFKMDPAAAVQFAEAPGVWLERLSTTALAADGPRRWLMLRCYLNPAGKVKHPHLPPQQPWLFFSTFRAAFVRAGFEVIDCPGYNATKNAADIRIVVDAVDALAVDARYEEFVIASGDSDMTPLLQRLRRADRRTVIVSPAVAAEAYTAIADQALDSQHLLALIQGKPVEKCDQKYDEAIDDGDVPDTTASTTVDQHQAYESFRAIVTAAYDEATGPLHKASLAQRLHATLGAEINDTNWFGLGGFSRAVHSLQLPNLRMTDHLLWDDSRHEPPEPVTLAPLPEPVARLTEKVSLPRLPSSSWPAIYETLSDYAQSHQFTMTHCTSWARDRLRERSIPVSRSTVKFIVRGTSFGGRPLARPPAPTADEVRAAFVSNLLSRANAAGIAFTPEETEVVRAWLGDDEWKDPVAAGQQVAAGRIVPEEQVPAVALGPLVAPEPEKRPGGLAPRELEVAGLVAQSLTNAGIARHLSISPRTVEAHLQNVNNKLGTSSRVQIATWYVTTVASGAAAREHESP